MKQPSATVVPVPTKIENNGPASPSKSRGDAVRDQQSTVPRLIQDRTSPPLNGATVIDRLTQRK
jgi:hypothetical protein